MLMAGYDAPFADCYGQGSPVYQRESTGTFFLQTAHGKEDEPIEPHTYVIRHPGGRFSQMDRETFESTYRPVDEWGEDAE